MLLPYPTEFPQDALVMVLDLTRGKIAGTPETVHACWVVVGYALDRTLGSGPAVTGITTSESDSDIIEQALLQGPGSGVSAGLFPWWMVISVILRLLARYAV